MTIGEGVVLGSNAWDWIFCVVGGGLVVSGTDCYCGGVSAIAALESKAALGFTIPTNPIRDHMTTNIGAGACSDPLGLEIVQGAW